MTPTEQKSSGHRGTVSACPYHADILFRLKVLGDFAHGVIPTKLPIEPSPEHFEELISDLEALWRVVDPLIEAYGEYLQAYAGNKVDVSLFRSQLRGALEGNATYAMQETADLLREEMEEVS